MVEAGRPYNGCWDECAMNDAQTWAVMGIFAAIFASQFVELRSDRKELRAELRTGFGRVDERLARMDERFESRFREVDGRLSTIEVTVGRIDERLQGVETRLS
jgi:hypothetical protein